MSNGSPHDPSAQGGEGYGRGQGYGQGYAEGYGGGYGEYAEEGAYNGEYGEYAEYGEYPDYGQQQAQQQRQRQGPPAYPQDGSYPRGGWGGESDQDATAFVQLPAGPLPPPGAGADAWGPLAAPGTGQGGYTPPPMDPAEAAGQQQPPHGQGMPPAAAGDGPSGQWAMPFGQGPAGPGGYDPSSYGQHYEQQHQQQRGPEGQGQGQQGQQPGVSPDFGGTGTEQVGPGGVTGQGAAAALAGSHEARTQRRPLGSGGGAPGDEAEPIAPGTQFSGPAAPRQSAAQQQQQHQQQQHQQDIAGGAHFAEAHARRQVPFDGHDSAFAPDPAADTARDGGAANGATAYAPQSHEAPAAPAGGGDASPGTGPDGENADGDADSDGSAEPLQAMGRVRSGLPFTPSSGGGTTEAPPSDTAPGTAPGPAHQEDADTGTRAGATASPNGSSASGEPVPPAGAAAKAPHGAVPSGFGAVSGPDAPDGSAGEPAPTDAGVSEEAPLELAPELGGEHPHVSYVLHVNGIDRPVTDAWIGESLLYVLRERLGLAGAKDGCSQGECGACSVQVDGRLVASCLVPAATAAGSEIRTVEGLAVDGFPSDVQRALTESGAVQCGFCVPGLAMTVHDLLEGNHAPTELETRKAICGNLCRCSGYRGVLDAVRTVVTGRTEQAAREAAEAEAEAEAYEQELADASARIPHQAGPGSGGAHFPGGGGA